MAADLTVRVSESGADDERLDALTRQLREELSQLDVAAVTGLSGGEAPAGTRGFDVVTIGGLVVSLFSSQGVLAVVGAVRGWLARGHAASPRSVRLEIDGDVLELTGADDADQERLVTLFVSRHGGSGPT